MSKPSILRAEIERLRTVMQAAYDALHDDNDAATAAVVLRVALQEGAKAITNRT